MFPKQTVIKAPAFPGPAGSPLFVERLAINHRGQHSHNIETESPTTVVSSEGVFDQLKNFFDRLF